MQGDSLQRTERREAGTALVETKEHETNELRVLPCALSPTTPQMLERITRAGERIRQAEQCEIFTEHVIHGGMYSRTITMPPERILEGAFVKVPTLVITVGDGLVLAGEDFEPVHGYQVRPASAKRKQLFISEGPLIITMIFPTSAKTVEEAEAEFTDDCELLLSRHQDANRVVITGE